MQVTYKNKNEESVSKEVGIVDINIYAEGWQIYERNMFWNIWRLELEFSSVGDFIAKLKKRIQ